MNELSNPWEINFLVGVSARFKLERLELSGVDCKFKRRNVNITKIYTFGSANACKVRHLNQQRSINSWLLGVSEEWLS